VEKEQTGGDKETPLGDEEELLKLELQRKLKKELDAERVRTKELEEKLNNELLKLARQRKKTALSSQTETAPDGWTGYPDAAEVQVLLLTYAAYVSTRQNTSADVSIRQHTSVVVQ